MSKEYILSLLNRELQNIQDNFWRANRSSAPDSTILNQYSGITYGDYRALCKAQEKKVLEAMAWLNRIAGNNSPGL